MDTLRGVVAGRTLARFRVAPGRWVLPDVCCDIVWVGGQVRFAGPQSHARESTGACTC